MLFINIPIGISALLILALSIRLKKHKKELDMISRDIILLMIAFSFTYAISAYRIAVKSFSWEGGEECNIGWFMLMIDICRCRISPILTTLWIGFVYIILKIVRNRVFR